MRHTLWLSILISTLLAACAAPAATPRPAALAAASTPRPFPSFGPTRTVTPTRTPRVTITIAATATLEATATGTASPTAASQSIGGAATRKPIGPSGQIARSAVPALLTRALIDARVANPNVYWFTFDEGDREQALMVQYDSPLQWQPEYLAMLRSAQRVLSRYFLSIDPPIYSAFIAATDLTGDSRITVRVRRSAAEKLARGEIGEDDFVNNYFEYVNVVMSCAADGCLARMATPFPSFDFPFPFPTPTKKP